MNLCLCTPTSIRLHVEHRGSDEIINNEWGIVDTEAPQIGTKNERLRVLATVARLRLELRHVAWKSQLTLAVPTPLPESLRYFSSDPHVVLLLALSILDLRCRLASVKVIARSLFLSLEKNVPLSLSFFLSPLLPLTRFNACGNLMVFTGLNTWGLRIPQKKYPGDIWDHFAIRPAPRISHKSI